MSSVQPFARTIWSSGSTNPWPPVGQAQHGNGQSTFGHRFLSLSVVTDGALDNSEQCDFDLNCSVLGSCRCARDSCNAHQPDQPHPALTQFQNTPFNSSAFPGGSSASSFIGVLDIFGFEHFKACVAVCVVWASWAAGESSMLWLSKCGWMGELIPVYIYIYIFVYLMCRITRCLGHLPLHRC